MSEEVSLPQPVLIDFRDVVIAAIRENNIHEGIWQLFIEFGLTASNMGFRDPSDQNAPLGPKDGPPSFLLPTAMIPIQKIGILRVSHLSNLAVDAAEVNPRKRSSPARKSPKKK